MPTIIEMVNHTRLDCVLGAAAGMRAGVAQAIHHAAPPRRVRQAARRPAADAATCSPTSRVESEAATRHARCAWPAPTTGRGGDEHEPPFRRLATAVVKYWVCKRAPPHAAEALECLGGNGYVEESGMPRLFRESPLNGIWEGSGNVICLDVLRALARQPASLEAFLDEVGAAAGAEPRLDAAAAALRDELSRPRRHRGPRAPHRRAAWRSRSRARCSCATPTRRGGRRVLRLAARRRLGARLRDAARRASTSTRSSSATRRAFSGDIDLPP